MKGYVSYFKLQLIGGLQYRAAAWAGIATQFFWGFLYLMIYEAFYANVSAPQPMSYQELVTYIWLQQAFLTLSAMWVSDPELTDMIRSGNIAYELCRPYAIYAFWSVKLASSRLSKVLLRFPLVLVMASLIPGVYRMSPPASLPALILFLVTLSLGLLVNVAINMLIYVFTFITLDQGGLSNIMRTIGELFSGMIVPLPLMPRWAQAVAYFMPFRLASDLPYRIYSGNIPIAEAYLGIAVQLIWIAAMIAGGAYSMKRITRRIVVQGG